MLINRGVSYVIVVVKLISSVKYITIGPFDFATSREKHQHVTYQTSNVRVVLSVDDVALSLRAYQVAGYNGCPSPRCRLGSQSLCTLLS
jgi:hypothetical protein